MTEPTIALAEPTYRQDVTPVCPDCFASGAPCPHGATLMALQEAREVIRALLPIAGYVSRGRGYVDVERYPDAAARRALGMADDMGLLDEMEDTDG